MRSIPVTGAFGRTRWEANDRKRDEKALKISDRNRKSNLLCKFGTSVGSFSAPLVALAVEAGGTNGR